MRDDERSRSESESADAVVRYFDEHPELLRGGEPAPTAIWDVVARRIEAPIVPLDAAGAATAPGVRRSRMRWRVIAPAVAAAAVLAVVSSWATYLVVTHAPSAPSAARIARAITPTQTGRPAPARRAAPAVAGESRAGPAVAVGAAGRRHDEAPPRATSRPGTPQTGERPRLVANAPRASAGTDAAAVVRRTTEPYDAELATLYDALRQRRAQLDPATVRTVEENLRVIDHAIVQARTALLHDPQSRFLDQQLNRALHQKVDLLRTAALLPSA